MPAPSVLVADDEAAVRDVVQRLLAKDGWRPVLARDGDEAAKFLSERSFDLVLTDLQMPGRDGIAVAEAARKLRKPPDVILMTAAPTLDTAIAGVRHGLFDYLIKPFAPETLLAVLGRWRRGWKLERLVAETETLMDGAVGELLGSLRHFADSLPPGQERERALRLLQRALELDGALQQIKKRGENP